MNFAEFRALHRTWMLRSWANSACVAGTPQVQHTHTVLLYPTVIDAGVQASGNSRAGSNRFMASLSPHDATKKPLKRLQRLSGISHRESPELMKRVSRYLSGKFDRHRSGILR